MKPPHPQAKEPSKVARLTVVAAWVDAYLGVSIIAMAILGVALVLLAFTAYEARCKTSTAKKPAVGICALIEKEPPWLLVTGLATAPALLLTWYWRTALRRRELDLREWELEQKDREYGDQIDARTAQLRQGAESNLLTFERELIGDNLMKADMEMRRGLQLVEESPTQLKRIARGIENGMRAHNGKYSQAEQLADWMQYTHFVGEALKTINAIQRSGELLALKMPRSGLSHLDLRGYVLRNVDFRNSKLTNVKLQGADLRGSEFEGCTGYSVEYDETTRVDDEQKAFLDALTGPAPDLRSDLEKLL